MNLKEAFRYQNYLTKMFSTATSYLYKRENLVHIEQEHMRKSTNPDAQDEIVDATPERPYAQSNRELIEFAIALLDEKHSMSLAIDTAKAGASIDVDAATSVNGSRRTLVSILEGICAIKPTERKTQGYDYKFNATGEQARYCYNIKETTTLDFDPSEVKCLAKRIAKEADETSAALDRCMIDVSVDFTPRFDISDSFEDSLALFAQNNP